MFTRRKQFIAIIMAYLIIAGPIFASRNETLARISSSPHPTVVRIHQPATTQTPGVEAEQFMVPANASEETIAEVVQHIKTRLQEYDRKFGNKYRLEVTELSENTDNEQVVVTTPTETTTFAVQAHARNVDMHAAVQATDSNAATSQTAELLEEIVEDHAAETGVQAEVKKVKVPFFQKLADKLKTTKRNLYFTLLSGVVSGAIASALEYKNIVQLIASEDANIHPSLALLTGLGVLLFEGAVQLKVEWYSHYITDKSFNPFKLTGEKAKGLLGIGNTWLKRFAVCIAFVGLVHGIAAWTGTRPPFEASFGFWADFLGDVVKDSGIYITSTQPLMEYMKAKGPQEGLSSNKKQLAIMEGINFAITQGANAAVILSRLPTDMKVQLPEWLHLLGTTELGPSGMISAGMMVGGSILWAKHVAQDRVTSFFKSRWQRFKNTVKKTLNACSTTFI